MELTYQRIVELLREGLKSPRYTDPDASTPYMCLALEHISARPSELLEMRMLIRERIGRNNSVWAILKFDWDERFTMECRAACAAWYETWIEELEANDITRC